MIETLYLWTTKSIEPVPLWKWDISNSVILVCFVKYFFLGAISKRWGTDFHQSLGFLLHIEGIWCWPRSWLGSFSGFQLSPSERPALPCLPLWLSHTLNSPSLWAGSYFCVSAHCSALNSLGPTKLYKGASCFISTWLCSTRVFCWVVSRSSVSDHFSTFGSD